MVKCLSETRISSESLALLLSSRNIVLIPPTSTSFPFIEPDLSKFQPLLEFADIETRSFDNIIINKSLKSFFVYANKYKIKF